MFGQSDFSGRFCTTHTARHMKYYGGLHLSLFALQYTISPVILWRSLIACPILTVPACTGTRAQLTTQPLDPFFWFILYKKDTIRLILLGLWTPLATAEGLNGTLSNWRCSRQPHSFDNLGLCGACGHPSGPWPRFPHGKRRASWVIDELLVIWKQE